MILRRCQVFRSLDSNLPQNARIEQLVPTTEALDERHLTSADRQTDGWTFAIASAWLICTRLSLFPAL
jgi:hypothetical protein